MKRFKNLRLAGLAGVVLVAFGLVFPASAARPDGASAFTPITPCRLLDTRPGPVEVGQASTLGAAETITLPGWGQSGNCLLPEATEGLALNVTAIGATAPTFLLVYPTGNELPLSSSLNPSPGAPPSPNGVDVALSEGGEFSVFNRAGSVDLVIDVLGYYGDHHHDDRYYRRGELKNLIEAVENGDVPTHHHDGRYHRKAEVDEIVNDAAAELRGEIAADVEALDSRVKNLVATNHVTRSGDYLPATNRFNVGTGFLASREGRYTYTGAKKGGRGLLAVDIRLNFSGSTWLPNPDSTIGLPPGFLAKNVVSSSCEVHDSVPSGDLSNPDAREHRAYNGFLAARGESAVAMRWWLSDTAGPPRVRHRPTRNNVPVDWSHQAYLGDPESSGPLRVLCSGVFEVEYVG